MDDFQALISSLGESVVTYVGKDRLQSLYVFGDPGDMAAAIELGLAENTWEFQQHAIDKLIEIREMFLDEVSISYRFVTPDSSSAEATAARQPDFSMV
ncbi:hypothetical protein [Nocardioides sp. GXZ039]|uniref:hypothetical protein n=1 Tax=Nocardioides sp. GXZ039 TaxID=3136018 RepID=UPI0030F3D156